MDVVILQAETDEHWREARRLVEAYAASLDVDLSFQQFAEEVSALPRLYAPPAGAFLLAMIGMRAVGCVGLRRFNDDTGEMKRLYTSTDVRGHGVGRQLVCAAIAAARTIGYRRVVLDTLPTMVAAQQLYASLGFKPMAAYRFNPVAGTRYLSLDLTAIPTTDR